MSRSVRPSFPRLVGLLLLAACGSAAVVAKPAPKPQVAPAQAQPPGASRPVPSSDCRLTITRAGRSEPHRMRSTKSGPGK